MFPRKEIFDINRFEGGKKIYVEEVTLTEERKTQINKYKKIVFGDKFNDNIDFLSDNITYISLGTNFEVNNNIFIARYAVHRDHDYREYD